MVDDVARVIAVEVPRPPAAEPFQSDKILVEPPNRLDAPPVERRVVLYLAELSVA